MRRAQGPRQREDALSRSLRGCGRAVVPRAASLRDARPVGFRRGGEAGGCGFPRLGFPPGAPLSEAPLSSADHRPGGKPIPVRSLALPHWGQPHGGHFRLECRRPPGPPAEISPPLTEHPRPPAVLRGPVARTPAVRVPHGSRASTVAAVHARPSANRSRRLRAWPASLSLAPPCGHSRAARDSPPGGLAGLSRTLLGTFRASPGDLAPRGSSRAGKTRHSPCGCAARSVAVPKRSGVCASASFPSPIPAGALENEALRERGGRAQRGG